MTNYFGNPVTCIGNPVFLFKLKKSPFLNLNCKAKLTSKKGMYKPLLRITRTWILEKSFLGKKYFGCINCVYKVGFYLGLKKR